MSNENKNLGSVEVLVNQKSNNKVKLTLNISVNLYRCGLELIWQAEDLAKITNQIKININKCLSNIKNICPQITKSSHKSNKKNSFYIDESNLTVKFDVQVLIETSEEISDETIKNCLNEALQERCPSSITMKKLSLFEVAKIYKIKYAI